MVSNHMGVAKSAHGTMHLVHVKRRTMQNPSAPVKECTMHLAHVKRRTMQNPSAPVIKVIFCHLLERLGALSHQGIPWEYFCWQENYLDDQLFHGN